MKVQTSEKGNPVLVFGKIYGSKMIAREVRTHNEKDCAEYTKQAIKLIKENYQEPFKSKALKDFENTTVEQIAKTVMRNICINGSISECWWIWHNLVFVEKNFDAFNDAANEIYSETEEPYWMEWDNKMNDFINKLPRKVFNLINHLLMSIKNGGE